MEKLILLDRMEIVLKAMKEDKKRYSRAQYYGLLKEYNKLKKELCLD